MDTSTESQEGQAEQNTEDEEEQPAKSQKGISISLLWYILGLMIDWSVHADWKGKK